MVVDWAIEQMNSKPGKPLFLAVGLFRPHIPWEVPEQWFDLYQADALQLPVHREGDLDDARKPVAPRVALRQHDPVLVSPL